MFPPLPVVGADEGTDEGTDEGPVEGTFEGPDEGTFEGPDEGDVEGIDEGDVEGTDEGLDEGDVEGTDEGLDEGVVEGTDEGDADGDSVIGQPILSTGVPPGVNRHVSEQSLTPSLSVSMTNAPPVVEHAARISNSVHVGEA